MSSEKKWKSCSACPVTKGRAECPCLEAKLPGVYSGNTIDRQKYLQYVPTMGGGTGNLFNTMSDEEESTRMRLALLSADLTTEDTNFLIDRIHYRMTYKALAGKYGMADASGAHRKYKRLQSYLREVLDEK